MQFLQFADALLISHCPLRCVIALTRQNFVTSSVCNLGAVSELPFGWLQNEGVSFEVAFHTEKVRAEVTVGTEG